MLDAIDWFANYIIDMLLHYETVMVADVLVTFVRNILSIITGAQFNMKNSIAINANVSFKMFINI